MEDVPAVSERLIEMEALMATFDRLIEKILKDEKIRIKITGKKYPWKCNFIIN